MCALLSCSTRQQAQKREAERSACANDQDDGRRGCASISPAGFFTARAERVTLCIPHGGRVTVLRVGDAWLVGVGKRAPHGLRCLYSALHGLSLARLKAYYICIISLHGMLKDRRNRARQNIFLTTRATIEVCTTFFCQVHQFGGLRPVPDVILEENKTALPGICTTTNPMVCLDLCTQGELCKNKWQVFPTILGQGAPAFRKKNHTKSATSIVA